MKQNAEKDLLKRLESGYSLPSLSVVAIKLVELASDETCSVVGLATLIEKDPSLATRLIRLANSAFFRTSQPAGTLRQAILRVGFHRLRIMALSLSLRDTFPMGRIGTFDYEEFWRASLYRALLAKSLARHLKTCNPEEAFIAALTLEIGYLIFFDLFLKGKNVHVGQDLDMLEELLSWEKEHYGIDHRKIGEVALRYWRFPETIIECQSCIGSGSLKKEASSLAELCNIAREFSASLLRSSCDFNLLLHRGREVFQLDDDTVLDIVLDTFAEVQEIADNLKIDMNKDTDLLDLLERANRALGRLSERVAQCQNRETTDTLPSFHSLSAGSGGQPSVADALDAVAHEIRNPLMAVAGFARKLSSDLDPSSSGGKYAQMILDEAMRLEVALNEMSR